MDSLALLDLLERCFCKRSFKKFGIRRDCWAIFEHGIFFSFEHDYYFRQTLLYYTGKDYYYSIYFILFITRLGGIYSGQPRDATFFLATSEANVQVAGSLSKDGKFSPLIQVVRGRATTSTCLIY